MTNIGGKTCNPINAFYIVELITTGFDLEEYTYY